MRVSIQVLQQGTKFICCAGCITVTGESKSIYLPLEQQGGIMDGWRQPLLLLWLTSVVATTILGSNAEVVEEEALVKNLTDKLLRVIPHRCNGSSVTELVIEGSMITLNETDRLALASYPRLEELHLDGNLVTNIPAKYFSVVPHLRALSLSGNKISSLDPESFSGLDVLRELDLSHNLLTSLHTQLFRQLTNLQVLKLHGNPWNCCCPLLSSIAEVKAAGLTVGGKQITCASPENQAGRDVLQAAAMCYPSPPSSLTTDPQEPVNSQNSSSQKLNINKDQTPVLGNTWKFAGCVAALAMCTSVLILCAIKGPSLYKLFHNYRHRRLRQEEEDIVSTVFSETGRHVNHQTFTFKQENGQIEEEEDGYFEDPYIKSEE
ncbi:leucine-rich repeat-containing protein 19 isoform X2 [Anarrhichthys ocellatus]|uniref:leucine-rich repeat-containing protein 19 isoform X2 n=1 Tax=Anarrhichthys ocellatus TaxID=433405 RepID=UPI0012ED8425|nr:leucine-rich repeat-containing protein 19 isoform X2 [Anarrhichthys ocellatus]